ncbi:MAG: YcxB family protein [Clostridiales bacterium]|nr:YcxB family protein [Clostridiales bacterium]
MQDDELKETSEELEETVEELENELSEEIEDTGDPVDDEEGSEEDSEDDEDDEYEDDDEEEEEDDEVEEEDEPLLTTYSVVDLEEYRKMEKKVPSSVFTPNLLRVMVILAIIAVAASFIFPPIIVLPAFGVCALIAFLVVWSLRGMLAEKAYNKMMSRDPSDTRRDYAFYDGYLRVRGKVMNARIQYYEIIQCIETEESFYLRSKGRRAVIILQKKNCSPELSAFIKGKFGNRQ